MDSYRLWTEEEDFFLQEHWGSKSITLIAKHLERSCNGLRRRASVLGLSAPSYHYEGIKLRELARSLQIKDHTAYIWIKKYSFPVKKKVFSEKQKVYVVSYDDFWKWAETHQHLIDFSKLEPFLLGKEPEWVTVKRKKDFNRSKTKRPWTVKEEKRLIKLVREYRYTYPELSELLKRPEGSISWKLRKLNERAKPIPVNRNTKYTEEDLDLILTLLHKGYGLPEITRHINAGKAQRDFKSAIGIREKLYMMGFRFRKDTPIAVPIHIGDKFKEHTSNF